VSRVILTSIGGLPKSVGGTVEVRFLIPEIGATPFVRFFDDLVQVGDLSGYTAVEISPMLYEVDVDTDLDAYDSDLIRVVIENPDTAGYIIPEVGLTVTLFNQSTADLVNYGLTNLATNIGNAIIQGLAGVTPQLVSQFDPQNTSTLVVVRRDDYNLADGRQIDIPFIPPSDFDPTGATGAFGAFQSVRGGTTGNFVGSVIPVEINGDWFARLQFTSAQLTTPAGLYNCDIELRKNTRRITVFSGRIRVLQDYAQA